MPTAASCVGHLLARARGARHAFALRPCRSVRRSRRSKPRPTMWTVSPAKVTEISVPVRYFMPCACAAAAARCCPPTLVVVGQGPELDAIGGRAGGQLLRGQGAVGNDGVTVQVGIENGHRPILGWRAFAGAAGDDGFLSHAAKPPVQDPGRGAGLHGLWLPCFLLCGSGDPGDTGTSLTWTLVRRVTPGPVPRGVHHRENMIMRWEGNRESGNVEDRRGEGGGRRLRPGRPQHRHWHHRDRPGRAAPSSASTRSPS